MDALMKEINAKLQLLALTEAKTKGIMEGGNMETIQRHLDALRGISKGVDDLKLQIEQAKITKGETAEEVIAWSGEIEAKLASIDQGVVGASKRLTELKTEANLAGQEVEEAALQKKRKEQLDFERAQLELKLEYDKKAADVNKHQSAPTKRDGAKLPKLTITKFNGTYEAWLPFWNKFIAEVDSVDLPAVTKFAYLKELVETKVQVGIDGLPFTTEGYERAKNILKSEYGKQSEIVNAYISNIMGLPVITSAHPKKIDEFYKKLLYNVQSLETLGRLRDVTGNVRAVLDKLKGIKADLVRGEVGWQDWDFPKLIEALHHWREINPAEEWESSHRHVKSFQAHERVRVCVYCSGSDHTPQDCRKVATLNERKRILSSKRLCFNCAAGRHRAGDCRSRSVCAKCGQRHHTSICDGAAQLMTATSSRDDAVVYPVVVVEVEGVRCRALLDTGAGSSYASATLLDRVGAKPGKRQVRKIEMMLGVDTREVELTHVKVASLEGDFRLTVEVTRVGKPTLLELENPKYREMLDRYSHLKGVKMLDEDTKTMLPVHLILGASEFARIKTEQGPRIGRPGEPVAEKTRFGWTIMSPGSEPDLSKMLLTQTSQADHESLCRLDVLGLQDPAVGDQEEVYREFREQLQQSPEGWYQTGLPWKGNHPPLPSNEGGSLRRLDSLLRKLERGNILNRYDNVIREQLNEGIVERVSGPPVEKEFYIPHKAVVRESAESTKLRIVYDASARASEKAPSLNECLHVGPPLQNKLWAVLVRARFQPVALTGDMKQAFLQIRIREEDRDTLRFHWISDLETKRVETFRFTRALFGLAPSPFLLAGVIKQHLESCRAKFPDLIREIDKSLYVDDLVSGGPTVREAQEIKAGAVDVFGKASIKLHKWHSNVPGLEAPEDCMSEETTFAKEQLGTSKVGGGSILGLTWNKNDDVLEIKFPADRASVTKRGVLGKIARVYDPLGLVSPMTLSGKLLYREACESKVAWDAQLPGELASKWIKWESQLPLNISVPRALPKHRERISNIELHGFGDASGRGISAAVYAIVSQPSGDSVGLVAAKSRLAKQGLTIPRLELVSGHMATNLIVNVKESLEGFPVGEMFCWLDSSVALHWIKGSGSYKQFVSNRVHKIQQHPELKWRHVSTKDNPADLGSRSGSVEKEKLWWSGPHWLLDRDLWPADIITTSTTESQAEAKVIREVFAVAQARTDILDILLTKHSLWRTLRICAWMIRFFGNSRKAEINRVKGPLTTEEINQQRLLWLRRVQGSFKNDERFEENRLQLNLQENDNGLLECRGRIQGDYPIYVPDSHQFADKLVAEAHQDTLHGGVGLTMAKVREQYWVPRLRRLTKKVLKNCHGCKRFNAQAFAVPPPGRLPKDRTEGQSAFEVIGVDFAGPLKYRKRKNLEGKAYITLYACSLTRGIYLDLLPSLDTSEFIRSLKRFIARRGRPMKIYSDNGRTFVGAAKWLETVRADERLNEFLCRQEIKWQFNLSRAPWWGGQFERMVGLVKRSLYKTIGNGFLSWKELEEVILDVEVSLNNRPLSYVEDDVQLPVLTPNTLLFGRSNVLPETEPHRLDNKDLRKRARHLKRCKEAVWKRWTGEYVKGLRERHHLKNPGKPRHPEVGEVVLIKSEDKNRGKWKIGIVTDTIEGRDGVVRAVKLRVGTSRLERAVQHLFPLELSCDQPRAEEGGSTALRTETPVFRPRRDAAVAANLRIRDVAQSEEDS